MKELSKLIAVAAVALAVALGAASQAPAQQYSTTVITNSAPIASSGSLTLNSVIVVTKDKDIGITLKSVGGADFTNGNVIATVQRSGDGTNYAAVATITNAASGATAVISVTTVDPGPAGWLKVTTVTNGAAGEGTNSVSYCVKPVRQGN